MHNSMYRFVQQFMESLDPVVFDTYVDIFGTWLEVCEMCRLLHLQVKYIVVYTVLQSKRANFSILETFSCNA